MDNTTPQISATAEPAEAENRQAAATGLGKFKDVDALLEAYNNLEAEFTRRSQRLRELERADKEVSSPAQAASDPSPQPQPQCTQQSAEIDGEIKAQIIAEYLAQVAKNKSVPLISGGVNVSAKRRTPSSVREAGALAQQFLNKRR